MEPSMTTKKRPCDEDGAEEMRSDNKSRRRGQRDDDDDDQKQEKEIEEFFAILRGLHVALQYFHKRPPPESSASAVTTVAWKPAFEPQDFEDLPDGNSGFDLNSEPIFKHHPPA